MAYILTAAVNKRKLERVRLGPEARGHTFSGLAPLQSVEVDLIAVNAVGESQAPARGAFNAAPPREPSKMEPPQLTAVDGESLSLRWAAPSSNGCPVTGYTLSLFTEAEGGGMGQAREVHCGPNCLEKKVEQLAGRAQYVVVLTAGSLAGRSPPSTPVAFQTEMAHPVPYREIMRIIEAMRLDILRGQIQEWGCKSLFAIASKHREWITTVAQLGAVPLVVRAMYGYPKSVSIATAGSACLRLLCDATLPDAGLLSIKAKPELHTLLLDMRHLPWRADANATAIHVLSLYDEISLSRPPMEKAMQRNEPAAARIVRQLGEAIEKDPRGHLVDFEGHEAAAMLGFRA